MDLGARVKKNQKILLWLGLALLVLVPVALSISRGGEVKQVDLASVAKQTIAPTILASGSLTYQTEIRMVSEVMGRVQEIKVKEGDEVRKGDLLLRLDPSTVQAQVAQLQAATQQSRLAIERQGVQLATLETRFKRNEQLRERQLIDANTFDEVRSQRDLARVELASSRQSLLQSEANLKRMREELAKTELRSPITGRVTQLTIKVGETAVPSVTSIAGSDLMIIADTSNLYAEVNVNETDVARITPGQEARIVPAAFADSAWKGIVETVAVSPRQQAGQSKTYPVKIRLEQSPDVKFHTGMSARAEIATRINSSDAVLAVPVQAVRYEESTQANVPARASVFVVEAGRAKQRFVDVGLADDTNIEVTKGLEEKLQIVTGPARELRFLRDGDRVEALTADASTAAAPATTPAAAPR